MGKEDKISDLFFGHTAGLQQGKEILAVLWFPGK